MKTREDYVSNSSSASFIVKSEKFNATSLLLELLSCVEEVTFYSYEYCNSNEKTSFSRELLAEIEKSDSYDAQSSTSIRPSHERFVFEQYDKEKLYEKILTETKSIDCYFGEDDCGVYTGVMSQLGTLLEMMGYEVEESGETSYSKLANLHLKHLDEIMK